jgi:hypothetical protein
VCPQCYGRATKIFNISTGYYTCQQCDRQYAPPNAKGALPKYAVMWEHMLLCGSAISMKASEILVIEAPRRRKAPPPIDTSGFANDITALMRKFVTAAHMQFKRDWADEARTAFVKRKAELLAGGSEDYSDADWRDELHMVVNKLWTHYENYLGSIRHNAEHAEQEYQQRAAERHHRDDDPDFYIESSDYLSGMAAMVRCAGDLQHSHSLTDPRSVAIIIAQCNSFIDEWDRYAHVTDGGEEAVIDEDFAYVIERLFPLMLLVFTKAEIYR